MGNAAPFTKFKDLWSSAIDDNSIWTLPPIRVIDFEIFKILRQFPRLPENENCTCTLRSVNRAESFVVFISHCWLRGWSGAEGWDGRPHPDNASHEKYRLCVDGITAMKNALAPGLSECYVWLDFGCINQDGNPAGELKQLDKIVEACDCIFTPIVDPNAASWQLPVVPKNYFFDYASSAWNSGPYSYLHRGWCRVEMFYAANIPVDRGIASSKCARLKAGLRYAIEAGRRPHFLFGTKEWIGDSLPITLPPLLSSYFEEWSPLKGSLTKEEDRAKIQELIDGLAAYMKWAKVGYSGSLDDAGRRHGTGKMVYNTGDEYEGEWLQDQRHGKGAFAYTNGDVYTGEWKDDKRNGHGRCTFANGNLYEGQWSGDQMSGQGHLEYATGEVYDGEFTNGMRDGEGTCVYSSKHVYRGHWVADKRDGFGSYSAPSGTPIEGLWRMDELVEQTKHAVLEASIDMAAVIADRKFNSIYELINEITEISGTDGLWKMWLARNKYTKEVVLARCYTSNLNEQQIQELLSEVHVHKIEVSKVPNVLKCLGYYEEGGVNRHLVFENPKGGELFDRIVARTSYSEDNSRKLVRKLLRVVLELHNRHIVHRCITAHTIYLRSLDDDTDILVGDFEFALKTTGNASLSTPCGNPAYVAPEVLSGKPYSLACDMWSVGVVTFVLLCGYYPFEQKDLKRQFSAIRKGKYSFNPPRNSQVSADAERFIAALLKLDPTRRATAEEALLHSWIA